MNRVSTQMSALDSQYHTMMREFQLNKSENRMQSGMRIQDLRDDPLAAAKSTRLQTNIVELEQYMKNIGAVRENMSLTEQKLTEVLGYFPRIQELAVNGANGIYDKQQYAAIADEIDQYIEAFADLVNEKDGKGNALFGGYEAKNSPFLIMRGRVEGTEGSKILDIQYRGDIGRNNAEITENSLVSMNLPGNYAFWTENQSVYSSQDGTTYQVQANSTIRVDGVDIDLKEGDNIYAIIHRINDSAAPVRARLDPVRDSLVLETTTPHQLWVEDLGGGTVLRDLGVVKEGRGIPPNNIADTAMVTGGSMFDTLISLRDSLYRGDIHGVNASLGGIELTVGSLSRTLGEIGALTNRLDFAEKRLETEQAMFVNYNAKEVDVDITEAIMHKNMLEFAHQASLNVAGKILRPTLLDFLR
ncbi:MAG: flagellar hook-associated protein 3 [Spirochaetales bacterium]|nr:flagellar hook-associated protein 3 [Spirochaetales bacterium]